MQQINWLDLDDKLVDRFDLFDQYGFMQMALGQLALTFAGEGVQVTPDFLNPFPITMSGSVLGGTVGAGIAYDANGQVIAVPTGGNAFTDAAADPTNPRWDLLVIYYTLTGIDPISKPTDPLVTVFLYLIDAFVITTRTGTPGSSPSYPAKQAGDVIIAGIKVPANATLGTACTVDLSIQEQGFIPSDKISLNSSAFDLYRLPTYQGFSAFLDEFLAFGAGSIGDDGVTHDSAIVLVTSVGTPGDSITIAGTTFTVGSGAGQIPVQATEQAMTLALARAIRGSALAATYMAAASSSANILGVMALSAAGVGGAISVSGSTFNIGAQTVLAGHAARSWATAPTVKQQVDQIDQWARNKTVTPAGAYSATQFNKVILMGLANASNVLTLPASASVPDAMIFVRNIGTGTPTVATSGSDTIQESAVPGTDTVLNLVPGRSVLLIPDGVSTWQVFFG